MENLFIKEVNSETGYISTHNDNKIKIFENSKSGYHSNIKGGNVTTIEAEITIKNDEVTKPFSSYQEQKKTIAACKRKTSFFYK